MNIIKKLCAVLILMMVASCGAITREKIFQQTVTIRDSRNNALLDGVEVTMNGASIGKTNRDGVVEYTVSEVNEESKYTLVLRKAGFQNVEVTIYNTPGGNYIAGGVALFLIGLAPGIVSLAVDGAEGTWYTFKQEIDIRMVANS